MRDIAVGIVADSMSASGDSSLFMGEDDPELVGDAFPVLLKMFEALLQESPDNAELHLTTGKGFIMYANAYLHTPATMLEDDEFERQKEMFRRAKRLYLRGRDYVLQALELKHPGFLQLLKQDQMELALKSVTKDDVPSLYWAAAGWLGAYSTDALDFELGATKHRPVTLMNHALLLDESFNSGVIHGFFISYYGALPVSMGGSEVKARYHFQKALEFSQGKNASPYVALATTVSIKNQDVNEFSRLLDEALMIDVDLYPDIRLVNILSQRKARWFLDHKNDKFLIESEDEEKK
ncbi:TRAP transporter TatT component family protein [bacterium]|nr:TRAP transporter TatT component family protein [bacterium]